MKNKRVLIIEASAKAALPLIESLASIGLHVVAASSTKINSGFFSRDCGERVIYPSCQYAPEAFKTWLVTYLQEYEIDQLFPVGHYGTLLVSEIQDEIRQYTRLVLPPHKVFWRGYAKIPTMKTAMSAGIPIPCSWFPHELTGGIGEALQNIKSWPILIKPSVGAGANGIVWCYKPRDVLEHWPGIIEKYGICFLQEFIPPGGMQYKVDMLVDDRQRRLAGIVYGKTRMYPPDGGSSVLNYTVKRPDIIDYAHRMLVELGWSGFCDFDFIVDPRDDIPKLMEINPRFPECLKMCTSVGINFPRMIYELAHGKTVETLNGYPVNQFLRFLPGDLMWFLRVSSNCRKNTWPNWFKFFDRDTAYQICSFRDPGPIFGYLFENLIQFVSDPNIRKSRLRWKVGPESS